MNDAYVQLLQQLLFPKIGSGFLSAAADSMANQRAQNMAQGLVQGATAPSILNSLQAINNASPAPGASFGGALSNRGFNNNAPLLNNRGFSTSGGLQPNTNSSHNTWGQQRGW